MLSLVGKSVIKSLESEENFEWGFPKELGKMIIKTILICNYSIISVIKRFVRPYKKYFVHKIGDLKKFLMTLTACIKNVSFS